MVCLPENSLSVSAPEPPTVNASIFATEWSMFSETRVNASLSILQYTTLILLCLAHRPVFWYKKDREGNLARIPQNRSYNPFLEDPDRYTVNASSDINVDEHVIIMAIDGYFSEVKVINVTEEIAGTFMCGDPIELDPDSTIVINISVHSMPEHQEYSQIIQGGFDNFLLPNQAPFSNQLLDTSFVYSTPPNVSLVQMVITPWRTFYASSNDSYLINQEFPSVLAINPINASFAKARLVISRDYNEVISDSTLEDDSRRMYFDNRPCKFVLDSHLLNGTNVHKDSTIVFHREFSRPRLGNHVPIYAKRFSAVLLGGKEYELFIDIGLPKVEFVIWATIYAQISNGTTCRRREITGKEAADTCGIRGFTITRGRLSEQNGLAVFVKAKLPCYLNITALPQSALDSSEESLNDEVQVGLSISIVNSTSIRSVSQLTATETVRTVFVNDSLILSCAVPACPTADVDDPPIISDWCKLNTKAQKLFCISTVEMSTDSQNKDWIWGKTEPIFDASSVGFDVINIDQSTVSNELTFRRATLEQSGIYTCKIGNIWRATLAQLLQTPATMFKVIVQEPMAPKFVDGRKFRTETVLMKRGTDLRLNCDVDGNPYPQVKWSWNNEPWNFTANNFNLLKSSMLEIDQDGSYVCVAKNKFGTNARTFEVRYEDDKQHLSIIILILLGILVLVCTLVIGRWWMKRRLLKKWLSQISKSLHNPPCTGSFDAAVYLNDPADFLAYNPEFEVEKASFVIDETDVLGVGEYGIVYSGRYKEQKVAVKIVKNRTKPTHYKALADELKLLSNIEPHVNVLGLVGACTNELEQSGHLCILTEYCSNGSLLDYLQRNRARFLNLAVDQRGQYMVQLETVQTLLNFSYQAAAGMEHLAASNIVHRDLALRNVFLTGNRIVKIADFGLACRRQAEHKKFDPMQAIPMYWMAVESLIHEQFSQMSDIWSFGVVMWEIFSCGERPYSDHEANIADFAAWLSKNEDNRLGSPKLNFEKMYELMRACWSANPDQRPNFSECKRRIGRMLEEVSSEAYMAMILALSSAWRQNAVRPLGDDEDPEKVLNDVAEPSSVVYAQCDPGNFPDFPEDQQCVSDGVEDGVRCGYVSETVQI